MTGSDQKQPKGYSADFMIRIKPGNIFPLAGTCEEIKSGSVYSFRDFLELVLQMNQEMGNLDLPRSKNFLRTFQADDDRWEKRI